jgi:hypothetical protein
MTISDATAILTTSVAVLGVYLAWSVRGAWKDEKLWTRDTEFCYVLLEKCYEAEANFEKLRGQLSRSRIAPPPFDESKTISKQSRQSGATRIFDLYDSQSNFWTEFFSLEYRARALLHDEIRQPFSIIRELLDRYLRAAWKNSDAADKDETPLEEVDNILWRQESSDPLVPDFECAISKIKFECNNKIRLALPNKWTLGLIFGTSPISARKSIG